MESLLGLERLLVAPWESEVTETAVERSVVSGWESLAGIEALAVVAWEGIGKEIAVVQPTRVVVSPSETRAVVTLDETRAIVSGG